MPNCVSTVDDACGRPGLKPLPANLTGGSGSSQGWAAVQMSGILPNGSPAGVIANIGSDGYSGGPAYFTGNGSDATGVVKVCRCTWKVILFVTFTVQFLVTAVADSVLQCVHLFSCSHQCVCCRACGALSMHEPRLPPSGSVLLRNILRLDGYFHRFFQSAHPLP